MGNPGLEEAVSLGVEAATLYAEGNSDDAGDAISLTTSARQLAEPAVIDKPLQRRHRRPLAFSPTNAASLVVGLGLGLLF